MDHCGNAFAVAAARGGFLDKALDDLRKVAWDRGAIRYGWHTKDDGSRVPLWHESEVALLAYAIQSIIKSRAEQSVQHIDQTAEGVTDHADKVLKGVTAAQAQKATGKKCPECGAPSLIKKDGCTFCEACGHMGSCG